MKTNLQLYLVLSLAFSGLIMGGSASADDSYNERYGEILFNKLPHGGMVSKTPWVGSWWAYATDGMAFRWNESGASNWKNKTDRFSDHNDPEKLADLSPAEKLDRYLGRSDKIEVELIQEILEMQKESASDVNKFVEDRRDLVHKLNTLIEDNADDSSFKWKDTEEGKKYVELGESLDTATEAYNDKLDSWKIDTATEFEIKEHGNAQFGVGSWFGHCNAWAAAAIVEDEPRYSFEKGDVPWTAADVKALLTASWMECKSSFYGSRNDYDKDETARERTNFKDVTPSAFHIFFADQIGIRDKSFVIDRYTGDQVWNQPVNAYRSKFTALYDTNDEGEAVPVATELRLTQYDYEGKGTEKETGEREVYPVSVKTTMWWVTDGLPHDALTVQNVDNSMSDADFQNHWKVKQAYDDQIHIRTLNYTLWLDKPMEDDDARIVGDGEWNHGSSGNYSHNHPDFLWQPLANTNNSYRVYENELIPYTLVLNELMPSAITPPVVEETPEETDEHESSEEVSGESLQLLFEAVGLPLEIPDYDLEGVETELSVESELTVGSMTVSVDIEHTYIGDLEVVLEGPAHAGNTVGCVERTTPTCDDCSCQLCVCETYPECCESSWTESCASLCTGECGGCDGPTRVLLKERDDGGSAHDINKVYDVKAFDGRSPKGLWKLLLSDGAKVDTGSLIRWVIEISPSTPVSDSSSASEDE